MSTRIRTAIALTALAAGLILAGCSPSYVITQDLDQPLAIPAPCRVGPVTDLLPAEIEAEDRPTSEDIEKFKRYIAEEIGHRDYLGLDVDGAGEARYEVRGRLLEYRKGSGFLRFMIGFGAGNAKVLTEMSLVDLSDGGTVFRGNFEGVVADWGSTGDKMFKQVARDFTKELEKQVNGGKVPDSYEDGTGL